MVRYIRANDELPELTLTEYGWVDHKDKDWKSKFPNSSSISGELIPIKYVGSAEYGIVGVPKSRGRYSNNGGYVPYKLENGICYVANSSPVKKDVAISWMKEFANNPNYSWRVVGNVTDRDGFDKFADARTVKQNEERFFKYLEKLADWDIKLGWEKPEKYANQLVAKYGLDLSKLICAYVSVYDYEGPGNSYISNEVYDLAKSICPLSFDEMRPNMYLFGPSAYLERLFLDVAKYIMEM